jgi:chemotaxis protein MotA
VATFWGVGVANFILLPLADYAHRLGVEDLEARNLMVQGLLLIQRRESPVVLKEKLVSFLKQEDRDEIERHFHDQFPDSRMGA